MTTVLTETTMKEKTIQLSTVDIVPSIKNLESETEIKNRREKIKDNRSLYQVFLTSILYTLHFVFITYIALKKLHSFLETKCSRICYWNQTIYDRIQHDKARLTKIPRHLSISVSRELLSNRTSENWKEIMMDISFVTCWAWKFGIKEVSVYDASGVLKSMADDFYKQQSALFNEWKMNCSIEEKEMPDVKFTIISSENGKEHIGHVTRRLAHIKDKVDMKLVDQSIHVNTISDPDLMIVYDGLPHNYISLDGYPPWHIRLTEITNCSNHHKLNYQLFSKCLYKFSKVDQRFGR